MNIFNIVVLALAVLMGVANAGNKNSNNETTRWYDWDTPVNSTPYDVKNDDSMTITKMDTQFSEPSVW